MSSRFELTIEAEDDVRKIIEYVAERFGIQRAEQLRVTRIASGCSVRFSSRTEAT